MMATVRPQAIPMQWLGIVLLCLFSSHINGWAPSLFSHCPNFHSKQPNPFYSVASEPEITCASHSGTVTILDQGEHHVVVQKDPGVICHHSGWAGSRSRTKEPEFPMLQRVRRAMQGRRVNLIHRLDRGASGCLLFGFANNENDPTSSLIDAMALANKTYIALVRGEGILHGQDFKQQEWFPVSRPIKDEKGNLNNATTFFRFVAGQDNAMGTIDRPRASLVLARPVTGRWHQIRRHLNGLSHPILGDSSHGNSQVNREWKKLGMPGERTCLHLAKLQLPAAPFCEQGIDVSCPLPPDMMNMLEKHLPQVLQDAEPILQQEGISLQPKGDYTVAPYSIDC